MDESGSSAETLHRRAVVMISSGGRIPLDAVGTVAADLLTELYRLFALERGPRPLTVHAARRAALCNMMRLS
jgi:hypothetical protein